MDKVILLARDGARAEIVTHGAHVCSWIPAQGVEQLFMSQCSELKEGVAIRGGVPIVFPQFSNLGSLPKHGFARTAVWRLVRSVQLEHGAAQAVFELQESAASLPIWPHAFHAELLVTVAEQSLQLDFSVVNHGQTAFDFQAALHSYFRVQDLQKTRIHGLGGLNYRNTVTGEDDCTQSEELLSIEGEIDRIYTNVVSDIMIMQEQQTLRIRQSGFNDTVVWNPGATKGSQLADLEPNGYQRMVCVEAAAIMQAIHLQAGEVWSASQLMEVATPRP